jgi:hypothetical protein
VASPEYLTLCWNGRPLGRITGVQVFDWPWVCGRFAAAPWPPELRAAVEAETREARTGVEDEQAAPYPPGFFAGWSVVDPAGAVREIGVPRVDFTAGEIEWR